ncbi:MAG TPA: VWA domain-containing protein, partial [Pyrinomonadaceae bacterium]|nr:VWA domain-containing protein [Pyrinomonadaceae bacterium]
MTSQDLRLPQVKTLWRVDATRKLFLLSLITIASTISGAGQSAREMSLDVTVADDKGIVATGLKREWFTISENKSPLQITGFETSDEPASVAVIVDLSNSISVESKKAFIQAVSQLIKSANAHNDYLIVGFNREISVIADWSHDQSQIEKQLAVASQVVKEQTALYDACSFALTKLASRTLSRRALVILSDGQDTVSKLTFGKLRDQIRASSTIVYAVGAI